MTLDSGYKSNNTRNGMAKIIICLVFFSAEGMKDVLAKN